MTNYKLQGQLEISPKQARNLPSRVTIGKQSPFVQFEIGKITKKTRVDKRGGRTPSWKEIITFDIYSECRNLIVKLYNDKGKSPDDYIGELLIDLGPIIEARERDSWYPLKDRDQHCGDIYLEITYYPADEPRPAPKPQIDYKQLEIEEGLSILSLKHLAQNPSLSAESLINQPHLSQTHLGAHPHALQTKGSGSSLSINTQVQDSPYSLTSEVELDSIMNEIRNVVDYPYQDANQTPPSSSASASTTPTSGTRRKPLPKIPLKFIPQCTSPTPADSSDENSIPTKPPSSQSLPPEETSLRRNSSHMSTNSTISSFSEIPSQYNPNATVNNYDLAYPNHPTIPLGWVRPIDNVNRRISQPRRNSADSISEHTSTVARAEQFPHYSPPRPMRPAQGPRPIYQQPPRPFPSYPQPQGYPPYAFPVYRPNPYNVGYYPNPYMYPPPPPHPHSRPLPRCPPPGGPGNRHSMAAYPPTPGGTPSPVIDPKRFSHGANVALGGYNPPPSGVRPPPRSSSIGSHQQPEAAATSSS